jgi:hypothetical protein
MLSTRAGAAATLGLLRRETLALCKWAAFGLSCDAKVELVKVGPLCYTRGRCSPVAQW